MNDRMTDAEIVESMFQNYIHQSSGTMWNWLVVKMDDDVQAEFNKRLNERENPTN